MNPDTSDRFLVHDIVMDVELIPGLRMKSNDPCLSSRSDLTKEDKVRAQMTVSVWTLNDDHYFTLMITSTPTTTMAFSRLRSGTINEITPQIERRQSTYATPVLQVDHQCPSCGSSISQSEVPQLGAYTSVSPLSMSHDTPAVKPLLSDVEKLVRMQDSLIDAMDIPLMAMWKDGSIATINRALARLMYQGADGDYGYDTNEILSKFKVYTEDFTRELTQEEYPIAMACRSEHGPTQFKMGVIDANSRRRLFEFTVNRIYDDDTGDFQYVLAVMKDVTW